MLRITPVADQTINPQFKGVKQNDNGVNYHHTNAGLKTGTVIGGLAALNWFPKASGNSKMQDSLVNWMKSMGVEQKEIDNLAEAMKKEGERMKKWAIPFGLAAVGLSIGCGALVDHLRNKKAKETADVLAKNDVQTAAMYNDNVSVTEYGVGYHKSNVGSKIGALLGAACGAIHGGMSAKKFDLMSTIVFALGGWIAGAITDSYSNSGARKFANTEAISANKQFTA